MSVLFGRFAFAEHVSWPTWLGVFVVLLGSLIIQFGERLS